MYVTKPLQSILRWERFAYQDKAHVGLDKHSHWNVIAKAKPSQSKCSGQMAQLVWDILQEIQRTKSLSKVWCGLFQTYFWSEQANFKTAHPSFLFYDEKILWQKQLRRGFNSQLQVPIHHCRQSRRQLVVSRADREKECTHSTHSAHFLFFDKSKTRTPCF